MKKIMQITGVLVLMLVLSSCKLGKQEKQDRFEATGTEAITMKFLSNSPPDRIVVGDADVDFKVMVEARNVGAYPESTSEIAGSIFIGGYDKTILNFKVGDADSTTLSFKDKFLQGRSGLNPNGGYDLLQYDGKVIALNLPVGKYNPTLSLTSCYKYQTNANPSVCIDPNPYSDTTKKICTIQPITLSSQGAPVAVTRIEEDIISNKIYFRITVKNVGSGDVLGVLPERCSPEAQVLKRDEFDLVKLEEIKLSNTDLKASCKPLVGASSDSIRLINGEGTIICDTTLTDDMKNQKQGYTTPLKIKLEYTYRNFFQKPIEILKLPVASTTP